MSLTITIPGAVNVTTGSFAPAVLTIGVGVPGAQGPQGPAGQGVPVGGTAGQFLTKIDGTNYNTDWTTVNFAAYAVKANNLSDLPSAPDARTNLGLGTMATASASNYSTTAVADTLYAPIAAGLPTGGTVGQVLTKNSGTNFDASFATLIPGDRYVTTSASSLSISNGSKSLTVGTGLAYTPLQDVTIALTSDPTLHHMHGPVTSYNSSTGALVVDVQNHTGSGTFTGWTVNVGGVVPLETVEWGEVLGTLGDQTDLATALNAKLELSGGVLTVNATIEASTATTSTLFAGDVFGVQLNANPSENSSLQYGGLLVQNAIGTMSVTPSGLTFPNSSTQTVAYPGTAGFLLKADNLSGLANTGTARTNLGLGTIATVNDAPSDGSTYGRNNGAWVVAGGGSSPADALTVNQVDAVADAGFVNFGPPAQDSETYGSGSLSFQDSQIGANGKTVTFFGSNSFSISNLGTSWSIGLMTDTLDPGYPKYVEDLVSYVNGQGLSLSASWSGTTGTDTVDGLTSYTFTLQRTIADIQSGDRLMIEQGLREYLTSNALSVSAAANSVLTYAGPNQGSIVGWSKPWQSEGYLTSVPSTLSTTTFTGKVTTVTPSTSVASLRLPHGTAPTSPVDGDVWTTTAGLFYRVNGATVSPATLAGGTYTGRIITAASTTAGSGFRLPAGTAPTSPVDGDMWTITGALQVRLQGSTRMVVTQQVNNTYTAGAKQTVSHTTASAGLNIGSASGDPTTPASGDVWHNSGAQHILGFSQTMRGAMTAVRAMCQVNVSGGTPSGVYNFNVSSVTDNGVGDFTFNFTNSLFDTNFLVVGSTAGNAANNGSVVVVTRATSSCRVNTIWNGVLSDVTNFSFAVLR